MAALAAINKRLCIERAENDAKRRRADGREQGKRGVETCGRRPAVSSADCAPSAGKMPLQT
jgi:hypothetical protein